MAAPTPQRSIDPETPSGNRLLNVFLEENPALSQALQLGTYPAGHLIYREGRSISHAYFPVDGALAMTIQMRDGAGCEAIAVGNEGLVGLPLYCGLGFSPHTVVQQTPGHSYRLAVPAFMGAIQRSGRLQQLLQRYTMYSLRFAYQTTACNTLHSIRQRACRWLLLVQDRTGGDRFELPQALLADMLGVRRQSISEVASDLRQRGLIEYSRGSIIIRNRRKLESAACCECYSIMNAYYDRLIAAEV